WSSPWIVVAAIGVWVASLLLGGKVDMYINKFETPVQFILGALAGIVLVLRLVPMLPTYRLVGFVGRHSLVYLALHQWFAFNLAHRLIDPILDRADLGIGLTAVLTCAATTSIGLLVLWPVCLAFDRWIPFLVGGGSLSRPAIHPNRQAGPL
ncbi:MAG TPA: hypothetical protein PKY05_16855, partial [Fibrobacteria bacterium]|nr:hypothetical protein [Fibrobacteria bacterium]